MATKAKLTNSQAKFSIDKFHPANSYMRGNNSIVSIFSGFYKVRVNSGIDAVDDTGETSFVDPAYIGYGVDYFNGCVVEFIGNCVNTSNLSVGEKSVVVDFGGGASNTVDDGTFCLAETFSGALQIGDEFIMYHPCMKPDVLIPARPTATPLASRDLWSSNGPIIVKEIFGIVTTTAVAAAATNTKITFDPDDGGSDVDLCANLDITGQATGTINTVTGDISDALVAALDVVEGVETYFLPRNDIKLSQAGDIKVTYGAGSAGQINWWIRYIPVNGILVPV